MSIKISGFQKTTLLDYPQHIASIIFLAGCNFCCPFCHNQSIIRDLNDRLTESEIFDFLLKRKGVLEAVCISGGEPTIHNELPLFIQKIKNMGFKVKLDTNGTNPEMVKQLIHEKLVDFIAMDIKNSKKNYNKSIGTNTDVSKIGISIQTIIKSDIDYEFRTTVVNELNNDLHDFHEIGQWIQGAKKYYIQSYKSSPELIKYGIDFTEPSHSYLEDISNIMKDYVENVVIR